MLCKDLLISKKVLTMSELKKESMNWVDLSKDLESKEKLTRLLKDKEVKKESSN